MTVHRPEVEMMVRRAAVLAAATLALTGTTPHERPACRGHSVSARLCSFFDSHVGHERLH